MADGPPQVVDENAGMFPRQEWFKGARLNFAQNLLFPQVRDGGRDAVSEDELAVIAATEGGAREHVSWKELRERVRRLAASLKEVVKPGDVVAGRIAPLSLFGCRN